MTVHNVNVSVSNGGTLAVGTSNVFAFWVPTDSVGGGITVTRADVASNIAIGAGSAPLFEVVTLGTNSAINGTVGTIAAGAFTAGTPKAMTLTSAWVDGSYGVAVKWAQTAINVDTPVLNVAIQYVMGR